MHFFLQVTNEDRLRLNQNLVNCRRALIEQNFMKKPLDGNSADGNFFKNTLRRLSSKKLDKLRAEQAMDPTYKGFSHVYWAFCKSDLPQTLSSNMTESDEQQALEVFHLILTYAGLLVTKVCIAAVFDFYQLFCEIFMNFYQINIIFPFQDTINADASPKAQEAEEDHVFLIQTVLDKAMKKDCLVNELFLQLIKQTTDHPEPNSRVNLR